MSCLPPSKPQVTLQRESRAEDVSRRSKRKWSPPLRVEEVQEQLREAGKEVCCSRIRFLHRFRSGTDPHYDPGLLRLEQDAIKELGMEVDRKRFVHERTPLSKLRVGTIYASASPVCTLAFTKLFGVSENLISAVKGNLGARASSTIFRLVCRLP